jgi:molecular chaperone DnaK
MAQYIGINFGTTNTSVVCIQEDEYGRKTTLLGEEGDYPFSSIVAIPKNSDEPFRFGRNVRNKRLEYSQTHDVYTSMKSYLGKPDKRFGGNRYSAKDIVTAFFRYIREYIKETYGIDITSASFSYPVDFTPEARKELFEAAKGAGIQVTMLVNESTAACVSFLEECRNFSKVMVLDWGGGTFDISILNLSGTNIFEVAVWGDNIGGDNIDRELAERTHSHIAANSKIDGGRFEDMQHSERDDMLGHCEDAKIEISNYGENYQFLTHSYGAYGRQRVSVSSEQLDDIVKLIVKKRVLTAIDKALGKSELSPSSINGIIIVGGSSNLTAYELAIRNHFENAAIIYDANKTQWATATGVALMQIGNANLRLSEDVCVRMSNDDTFPILKKGHPIGVMSDPVSFALVEESFYARFIFTDITGKNEYKMQNVPTKGLLNEGIVLKGVIDADQIARINFTNTYFAENYVVSEINKLNFHYDISSLVETKTEVKI